MSRYELLFRIDVRHDYFQDNELRNVSFEPTRQTEALARNLSLLVRTGPSYCAAYYDADRLDALRATCQGTDAPVTVSFMGRSQDRNFPLFTASGSLPKDSVFWLRNRAEAAGMHEAATVGVAEIAQRDDLILADVLDADELRHLPNLLLSIRIGDAPEAHALEPMLGEPAQFHATFGTRRTRWKYYLIGAPAANAYRISGTPEIGRFARADDELLGDDTQAITFLSEQNIPLRDGYTTAPQLRTGDPPDDQVVIRHLPLARADCRNSAIDIDGETLMSELYINY